MIWKCTEEEWTVEGRRLFGGNRWAWRFICPVCSHVACGWDWKAVGAELGEIAFSCIGRHVSNPRAIYGDRSGPCDYAGGGLFHLNPVHITHPYGTMTEYFDFYRGGVLGECRR